MIQVSIVSGTYNRFPLLKRMVESVRACVDNLFYEIVLVDGGSTDGTLEWCREQEDVVLVEQGELLGAVKAFNAGFAKAQGEYIVILNDDVTVMEGTIKAAHNYLEQNGDVGQVAFHHEFANREMKNYPRFTKRFGYETAQCSMVRRFLGDFIGWWGTEYHTYAGDSQLSCRIWELGWKVTYLDGCGVIDYLHDDDLRRDRRKLLNGGPSASNIDTKKFVELWPEGKLPLRDAWISIMPNNINHKAARGLLRTVRLKEVPHGKAQRMTMINEFGKFGEVLQFDQRKLLSNHNNDWRVVAEILLDELNVFNTDLLVTQIQSDNPHLMNIVETLRKKLPKDVVIVNYDGDARVPVKNYHFHVCRMANLQLVSSASAVEDLVDKGFYNVGWLLGSAEEQYFDAVRQERYQHNLVFLANYYGDFYPEGPTRKGVVETLRDARIAIDVFGRNWDKVGLSAHSSTHENHERNVEIYTTAKLGLSISAFADLYGYTSDRLWMICATGCPALVQRFDGMEHLGFIDGKTCIAWTSLNELVEKTKYALEDDDWREDIGRAGKELMLQRHTYEHRVAELLSMLSPFEEVSCYKTQMYY